MKRCFIMSILCLFFLKINAQTLPNPIMFCTQVPQPAGFGTSFETFGNHQASTYSAPRGGDLYIKYPNGTLKNLTAAAGYGQNGMQLATSIAVRDPSVHWSGTKAVFSMAIGSATARYQIATYFWQLYEISGLGQNDTPVITKIPNQPNNYNNISPIYGTDDRIIFTSDMPRGGIAHHYPQHDEYESSPIVSGIWRLDPLACSMSAGLEMLTHSPSGDFTPSLDKAGRLIFTRWDHLQRDQQADADIISNTGYGTFNYADETQNAVKTPIAPDQEVFPEPRPGRADLLALDEWANTNPQNFNIFNPWMMNEDGTEMEMLNHIGRHEMGNYMTQNFYLDLNLTDFYTPISPTPIRAMFHIRESPVTPGLYYGIEAPEFATHASGMVVKVNAPPGMHPEQVTFTYVTHPDTRSTDNTPSPNHSGLYRNPVPLSDGQVIVTHTNSTEPDGNIGTSNSPQSKYDFRIRFLEPAGSYFKGGTAITGSGITKSVSWWSPDEPYTYNGVLWEMYPVEVKATSLPVNPTLNIETVAPSEQALFATAGVNLHDFRKFLKRNDLSVLAIRDVTSRDDADRQQPFNLKVFGTTHQTTNPNFPNNIYTVKYLQFLQNDMVRGIGGINTPKAGRRGIAKFLHDPLAMTYNPIIGLETKGRTEIHPDGSAAMVVPAKRALSWQLTDENNKGIVRERLWISTKAGEVRTCTSCHGESTLNQAGQPSPTNAPQALTTLLNHIKVIDSDNDGVKDIYDAFPNDVNKNIAEAVNENFTTNLANWINQNLDNDVVTWTTQSNSCHANSAMINNRAADNTGKIDRLKKVIDLSNFDVAQLTFDVAYARYDDTKFDRLKVYAVICNGTQTTIYDKSGTDLATAPDQTSLFTPTDCNQWRTETIDLSAFAGKKIEIVFEDVGGNGNRLFLDNILIREIGANCPSTQSFSGNIASGIYRASNTISNQNGGTTTIQATSNVILRGGKSIILLPKFEAQSGSVFKAEMGGCN